MSKTKLVNRNIALIPPLEVMKTAISMSHEIATLHQVDFTLNRVDRLPHLTLHQLAIPEQEIELMLEVVCSLANEAGPLELTMKSFSLFGDTGLCGSAIACHVRSLLDDPYLFGRIAAHHALNDVIAMGAQGTAALAMATVPLMADPGTFVFDADKQGSFPDHVMRLLQTSGRELVWQEIVTLSTTPVYEDGRLVARPMCLRVFLVRTASGWQMMPGGYARVSGGNDPKALAMQRGGQVADVWIVSDTPVPQTTLLTPQADAPTRAFSEAALPPRAADNLFWVGRNVERAEFNHGRRLPSRPRWWRRTPGRRLPRARRGQFSVARSVGIFRRV